MRGM
jgi:hypothetical protein